MNKVKKHTIVNYAVSGVFWLSSLLVLLFNLLGLWQAWHMAGLLFFFIMQIAFLFFVLAILICISEKNKKYLIINLIPLGVSFVIFLFTIIVSTTWFW